MTQRKRKLTGAEKAERKRRKREYQTVCIGGKQKRVRRPPLVEGLPVEEFIRRNADPTWLHENEMWWEIEVDEADEPGARVQEREYRAPAVDEDLELPF